MGCFKALIVACLSFVCLTTGSFASGCLNDGVKAKKASSCGHSAKSSCGHKKATKKKAKSSCGGCTASSKSKSNSEIAHITPGMKRMENLRKQLAEEMGYVYKPSVVGVKLMKAAEHGHSHDHGHHHDHEHAEDCCEECGGSDAASSCCGECGDQAKSCGDCCGKCKSCVRLWRLLR